MKSILTLTLTAVLVAAGVWFATKRVGGSAQGAVCAEHGLVPAECPWCDPTLVEKLGMCGGHGVPEALCWQCHEKLIAAYPVTIGSAHTESPIGEWKVRGIAKMPKFRYDKEMLEHGERSGNFYMLPPGPRNPVGVMWIALNKKGIGIHGTNDPGSIGRAASHGCIRLANWDVVRLATKIKAGDNVSIH